MWSQQPRHFSSMQTRTENDLRAHFRPILLTLRRKSGRLYLQPCIEKQLKLAVRLWISHSLPRDDMMRVKRLLW